MTVKSIIQSLIIFQLWTTILYGQLQFRNLQTQDGLSQSSVVAIEQDQLGNLWFATQDGLNKYYGEFEIFEHQFDDITRKSHHTLGKLFVDHLDRVWMIEKFGNLSFKEGSQVVNVPEFGKVAEITQDKDHNYWLVSRKNIIYKTDINLNLIDSIKLNCQAVYDLQKHPNNGVLIANDKGLIQLTDNLQQVVIYNGQSVSDIQVKNDRIYFSLFSNVVFVKTRESQQATRLNIGLDQEVVIYSILLDSKDKLWIGSYGNGLYVYDMITEDVANYVPIKTNPYSFSYHDVLDIFEDELGTIWIGTDGGGICFYDQYLQKFHLASNITLPEKINVDVVRAIYSDEKFMSLGISGKGLTRFDKVNNHWKSYNKSDGLFSDRIMALEGDGQGGLWLGSQFDGLAHLKFDNEIIRSHENYLDSMTIWNILKGKTPNLYLGTQSNGLITFNTENHNYFTSYPNKEYRNDFSIRSLTWLDEERIMVGTDENGVYEYHVSQKLWKIIGKGILPKKIKHVFVFGNRLFVSSNGYGLYIWDLENNSLVAHYDNKNGLPNNVIYGALTVDGKEVWVSSNRGLSRIDISDFDQTKIKNYGISMGLQSLEFNTGAHFLDYSGHMFFGGINGVNWFHPQHLNSNPYPPKTNLLSIAVKDDVFQASENVLELPFDKNSINFHVSCMAHTLPEEAEFIYRLKGFDEAWKYSKESRFEYMNIPPGNYVFECKSRNYDGVESIHLLRQKININQAWYLSNWFKLMIGSILFFILWKIRNSEMKALRLKNEKELEKERNERLKEVGEVRKKFFTNISHEIRTPLTIINGLVDKINGNNEIKSILKRNSTSLLELLEQLLKVNKLESANLVVHEEKIELISFLRVITEGFASLANDKNISLNFYSALDQKLMIIDKSKLKHIVENLLNNAIKYTLDYGKVILVANIEKNEVIIDIQDSGIGIDKEDQKKIFNRYYQIKKSANSDQYKGGIGVGLSIVKDLISAMSGSINLTSRLGLGSKFTITVPFKSVNQDRDSKENLAIDDSENKASILLVDDNKDLVFYYEKILSNNYHTLKAFDGSMGIEIAEKIIPDLILTDLMMPNTDGIALVKKLKSNKNTDHIPIIVLSAKTNKESKLKSLAAGANAIMHKPFDEEELLVRIEGLLNQRHNQHKEFQLTFKIENPKQNSFIESVGNIIEENISNPEFSIQNICDKVHLERSQLYRKVKAITGFSPNELITKKRMEKAKELLSSNNISSIKEVAIEVGYFDISYFSRVFKKHNQQTPKQFRDSLM